MRNFYFILFIFLSFSCNNKNAKQENQEQKTEQNLNNTTKITNSISEVLIPETKRLVDNWEEYKSVEALIGEYYNVSPKQAVTNAENLANAIKQLKDSIRIEKFKSNDIKIRINVLYNNSLNLSELNNNINLDDNLIKDEVSNMLAAFSALNSKLNNIIQQEMLEEELEDFNN